MEHLVGGTGQYLFIDFCGSFHVLVPIQVKIRAIQKVDGPIVARNTTPRFLKLGKKSDVWFPNSNFSNFSVFETHSIELLCGRLLKNGQRKCDGIMRAQTYVWRDAMTGHLPRQAHYFSIFGWTSICHFCLLTIRLNWLCELLWRGSWYRLIRP